MFAFETSLYYVCDEALLDAAAFATSTSSASLATQALSTFTSLVASSAPSVYESSISHARSLIAQLTD